jgi:molybdopterin synthase sulfur carrier subunit
MRLLYFAWLKQRTGVAEEEVTPPASVTDVGELITWLQSRGPGYAAAFKNPAVVRVAENQEYVGADHPLRAGDEVALFPPVTGG